jgi:hypothetical protein
VERGLHRDGDARSQRALAYADPVAHGGDASAVRIAGAGNALDRAVDGEARRVAGEWGAEGSAAAWVDGGGYGLHARSPSSLALRLDSNGSLRMTGFSVDFVSPVDFNHLAAEICFDGQIVCRVKSERPDRVIEVDFFYLFRKPLDPLTVPFDELLALVSEIGSEVAAMRGSDDPTEGAS